MDILVPLFWVVMIIIWIVSALTKKQAGTSQEEQSLAGREDYRKPEEALEGFLRRLTGEEEVKTASPLELNVEKVIPPPSPPRIEEEKIVPLPAEEPVYQVKLPEKREEVRLPLLGTLDISSIRQGIILSEILGPPRGKKPL